MTKDKTQILIVVTSPLAFGGIEQYVLGLINSILQHKEKFCVSLLSPYECTNISYKENLKNLKVPLYEFNLKFDPGRGAKHLTRTTAKFFKQHSNFDVVHVHSSSKIAMAKLAYIAKKMLNAKVILHSHCSIDHNGFVKKLIRLLCSFSINRNADYLCACSKIAAETQFTKGVQDKVIICNNGVDTSKFKLNKDTNLKLRKQLNIKNDDLVIGNVARFCYQKNQTFLVDVFREIIKQHKNSKLLFIGEGEDLENIKEKVKEYKLKNNVIFLHKITNIQNYMQVMDVFVMPSIFEGLPIAAIEAQAAGLPLILSDSISEETKITKDVKFLSLNDTPEN